MTIVIGIPKEIFLDNPMSYNEYWHYREVMSYCIVFVEYSD